MTRTRLTWYGYLLAGFFQFILNIQANIIPFLRDELALSYRVVGLHLSAIAVGMMISGLVTAPILARLGRRRTFMLAVLGAILGMALLGIAPNAGASIASCAVIGLTGAMLPGVVAGLLAQLHPADRDQAFAECGAMVYAFGIVATLSAGAAVAAGIGWRGALALGAALGIGMVVAFGRGPIPEATIRPTGRAGRMPRATWAHLATMGLGVAAEMSTILWCPTYLENVVGFSRAGAAAATAAFSAAMVVGRVGGSILVRRLAPSTLYPALLALILPGFALYWGVATPLASVAGLFVMGLAVSMLYPLSIGFAMGAAGPSADAAGVRSGLFAGTALLTSPFALGGLADSVGLYLAHLAIPALALATLGSFAVARALERPAVLAQAGPSPTGR